MRRAGYGILISMVFSPLLKPCLRRAQGGLNVVEMKMKHEHAFGHYASVFSMNQPAASCNDDQIFKKAR